MHGTVGSYCWWYGIEPTGSDRNGQLPWSLPGQDSWPSGCGSARAGYSLQILEPNLGERFRLQRQSQASALWMSIEKCTRNVAAKITRFASSREKPAQYRKLRAERNRGASY